MGEETPADTRSADYATARHILLLLESRRERFLASRGRAVDFSRLMAGEGKKSPAGGPPTIDPLEAWCIDVGWCLGSLGKKGAHVLTARLTRRQKSQEQSWGRIAGEVDETVAEVKRIFEFALAIFTLQLEMNHISPELQRARPPLMQHVAEQCAAQQQGERCAIRSAA